MSKALLPGSTIGVFGSGQLGRMLALAARPLGYRVATYSPEANSPTGQVADAEFVGAYDDLDSVRKFCQSVDAVTFEFENVPAAVSQVAHEVGIPVRPDGRVLHIAQNRLREKSTLHEAGLPVTPFLAVSSVEEFEAAARQLGTPLILKTASFGYDGKGQIRVEPGADFTEIWQTLGTDQAVAEAFIDFELEVSVVAARSVTGDFDAYGVIENIHRNHILDISIAPARISEQTAADAVEIAQQLFEALDVIGVLCVEFFVQSDGNLLINEIAPRPHNSGHLTIDATQCSQFEQQLRAVAGLPLGTTEFLKPVVMVNLLGDLWENSMPNWEPLLAQPGCHLHLYGKAEARPGRKMGHFTVLGDSVDNTFATATDLRERLEKPI